MWPKKTDLEKELDVRDRGPVSNNSDRSYTACGMCFHRVHVVIKKSGERSFACPVCLKWVEGYDRDHEEEWLRKNLGGKNGTK